MLESDMAPAWLRDEQELMDLLHAALDRFDRQPASARQRDLLLPAEQYLATLARADVGADQMWSLVQELEQHGVLTIRRARRGPFDPDWKDAKLSFSAAGEQRIRQWLQREPLTPELQKWREAVRKYTDAFPGGCDALLARRIAVEGCSSEDVVAAFARISGMQGPLTLRQLSALAFLGDSKVLDDRGELIAALFPQLEIRERAIVVAVHLPPECDGVLFIENQDTYTSACGGSPPDLARLALVYAAGFRSSGEHVRVREGAILHYAGIGEGVLQRRFETWWYEHAAPLGPCWFWGDLDFAGMQILKALRGRFGEVRAWQPGYAPMLAALCAGRGYSMDTRRMRGQVDPGITGCAYADDFLLPAVRKYGTLDQELRAPGSSWIKHSQVSKYSLSE
jgi:hypothetical protein